MNKWLWRGLLLCLLLVAAYVALPWYSARQLVAAAQQEDVAQLQRYIDFPQLRSNIKLRLQDRLQESMGSNLPPELGGLISAGTDLILGPIVDRLISPRGVSDLIQGRRDWRELEKELQGPVAGTATAPAQPEPAPAPSQPGASAEDAAEDHRWRVQSWHFTGANRVEVICGSEDVSGGDDPEVHLFLERQGLRWRLVDMALLESRDTGD